MQNGTGWWHRPVILALEVEAGELASDQIQFHREPEAILGHLQSLLKREKLNPVLPANST